MDRASFQLNTQCIITQRNNYIQVARLLFVMVLSSCKYDRRPFDMAIKEFDLNIEKVLENWSVAFAIREVIANALDEQTLTNTDSVQIYQDDKGLWHIRDYGRGLQHIHLTQNENEEKLSHPQLIGKFGVGLKDALATFDRHNIGVVIDSKYGHFTIGQSTKHGFNDITTLHAYIAPPSSRRMKGTDFCLSGVTQEEIDEAKQFFLRFAGLTCKETTEYGDIYSTRNNISEIFINGIKVAEEENFLFSYNITSLNSTLKKALNRERTNVGRSAYSDRVRAILLKVKSESVIDAFTHNLTQMSNGTQCDEMKWIDVQTHAVKLLHAREETVFITPEEMEKTSGRAMEIVYQSGKTPVFVPNTVKDKIVGEQDEKGQTISTIDTVVADYNKSFEYKFIAYEQLKKKEQRIFDLTQPVLDLLSSKMKIDQIFISEKMKQDGYNEDTLGVYEPAENRIVILRKQLASKEDYLGTLIHEIIHADTGYPDISRLFESKLTKYIGLFAAKVIKAKKQTKQ